LNRNQFNDLLATFVVSRTDSFCYSEVWRGRESQAGGVHEVRSSFADEFFAERILTWMWQEQQS